MIYKNGIPYDTSYQVKDSECLPYPNTLENITLYNRNSKIKVDNSWLPYMTITQGQIQIGTNDNYMGTRFWNIPQEIFLEADDIPVAPCYGFQVAEQIYIYNHARWAMRSDQGIMGSGAERIFVRDDTPGAYYFQDYYSAIYSDVFCLWLPNGEIFDLPYGIYGTYANDAIYCADKINVHNIEGSYDYETIYYNDDATLSQSFESIGFAGTVKTFDKAETEWLENYFNIKQDGTTLEWYNDTLSNNFGKYIRLKKNNETVEELCYWKDDDIEEEIGINMTDSTVTKTGSITKGDITKTYSVTQKPVERTIKYRLRLNIFEEDGWTYNHFELWPFISFGDNSPMSWSVNYLQVMFDTIKMVRYKKAEDSEWTIWPIPTAQQLINRIYDLGIDIWNISMSAFFTLDIEESGIYDIEIMYLEKREGEYDTRLRIRDRMWAIQPNDYPRAITNRNLENQQDGLNPWIISIDMGGQYEEMQHDDSGLRMYDWGDNVWVDTFSASNVSRIRDGLGALRDTAPLYANVVYSDVIENGGTPNWISQCTGSLFYNIPERQQSWEWFLHTDGGFTKLYLHPDIYALENHGFDNTVSGWERDRLDDFLYNRGGEVIELPSNWRELVPNYIGD